LAYPAVLSPTDTLADMGAELPAPGTLDADRLGATLLQLQAASAPVAAEGYAVLALPATASSERATAIHNATPLFAALAVARAEAGAVDDAMGALRQSQTATETAVNLAGQQATLAARLAIMRQFRLRDVGLSADAPSGLVSQAVFPEIQPQLFATWGLAAPAESPPIITPNLAHAWWRSQPVLSAADFEALLARLPGAGIAPRGHPGRVEALEQGADCRAAGRWAVVFQERPGGRLAAGAERGPAIGHGGL